MNKISIVVYIHSSNISKNDIDIVSISIESEGYIKNCYYFATAARLFHLERVAHSSTSRTTSNTC